MSALHVRGTDGLFKDIKTIRGLSAYQVAVKEGFKGTEQEWLDSLKGQTPEMQAIVDSVLKALPTWNGGAY